MSCERRFLGGIIVYRKETPEERGVAVAQAEFDAIQAVREIVGLKTAENLGYRITQEKIDAAETLAGEACRRESDLKRRPLGALSLCIPPIRRRKV